MSFNLLDAVKGHFNSDLISKAASFLGESEGGISKALGGILPSVLHGIASKAGTSSGAEEVVNMAKEQHSSGLLGGIGDMFSNGGMLAKGAEMLKGLFGGKLGGIADIISGIAGIKSSSVNSLMSVAAPVALGTIGKHAAENNLGASGISSLLSSAKGMLAGLLPAGVGNLLGGVGGGATAAASTAAATAANYADDAADRAKGGIKWLVPLLLLAALGFLAWWMLNSKSCAKTKTDDAGHGGTAVHGGDTVNHSGGNTAGMTADMPKVTIDSTGLVTYDLGKEVEFDLGNGTKIMAAQNGFESMLLNFIKTGKNDTVDKKANWFNMFDVQFKTGGNAYTGKAEAMLKNCAAILKAYPAVNIKLGGYTDNTGAADVNKRISQQRADRVKADLVKMGAAAGQVIEAVGYGPEFPVCEANDTPECKARNRRVACKAVLPDAK